MTGALLKAAAVAAALLLAPLLLAPLPASAEPTQLKSGQTRLNGNLELPPGKKIADGVVLILHSSLGDDRQEIVTALQQNLKARGVGSLAVTLSLGIDNREGPRACGLLHDYALAGTERELAAWLAWLHAEGARKIDLIGFSRGATQIAELAPKLPWVGQVVLIAPAFATAAERADAYQRAFGHPITTALADARKDPLGKMTVDFLQCRDAQVLGATFLDAYQERLPQLAADTKHSTLVVIAGKDDTVPDLATKLPSAVPRATIENADHFFSGAYGEQAADAIAKFLKKE
jgi:pimeloyl-ACP methyl ester carboxylesterase